MYGNVAYLNNSTSVVEDLSKPLLVSSCGYYKLDSAPSIKTNRALGRKDYQLLYILEGKGHFLIDGEYRIIEKGEMVVFRPFYPQVYYYDPKDKCQVYWVHFTGSDVDKILSHHGFAENKTVFFAGITPDYPWLFDKIIRELQQCRVDYEDYARLLLQHIFMLAGRYLKEDGTPRAETATEIERAARYFSEHYKENISIEKYAQCNHMSACWFIRKFKQVLKITPMQYIVKLRITNAKILLEANNFNIAQVANAVGYDNPLYFTRLFTKHTGMSPTEYKKQHTEE